jgi:chromosome segregation ATPase
MSEEQTQNLTDGRSFEERVFARFDALDARFNSMESRFDRVEAGLRDLDARVQRLEEESARRAVETKPIWERVLKEIVDTRRELTHTRRELTRRLDRFESTVLEVRASMSEAEDRLEQLESNLSK